MVNRDNYKDVLDFIEYHQNILLNTKHSVNNQKSRLNHALIWADDVPFSECHKIKKTFPMYLTEKVNSNEITNDYASRLCIDFREFLKFEITQNKARYNDIKLAFIDSIRVKTFVDSAKTVDYYTLEDMEKIARYEPKSLMERKTQAGACFLYLSGMRIGAFVSMPIECVDIPKMTVYQFPEMGVYTKFKKRAVTSLFNIPFLLDVVKDWDTFIRQNSPSGATWYARLTQEKNPSIDPYFPETKDREKAFDYTYKNAESSFRKNLNKLCTLADVDYKHPHAFRHGHVHYGLEQAKTAEQVKAVSQNVMHNSTAITDKIYSRMTGDNINSIITSMGTNEKPKTNNISASDLIQSMSQEEKMQLLKELLGM